MNQSLLDWLNAVNNEDKNSETGLLLAPIDIKQQDNHEDTNLIQQYELQTTDEIHEPEEISMKIQIHEPEYEPQDLTEASENDSQNIIEEHEYKSYKATEEPENDSTSITEEHEYGSKNITGANEHDSHNRPEDYENNSRNTTRNPQNELQTLTEESKPQNDSETDESQELNTLIGIPEDVKNEQIITEAEAITRELQSLKNEAVSIQDNAHSLDLNKAWHEASAGFELSMKEPPPQIWTSQNETEDDETESEDYEHIILQQNSSVTLHGTNFTQRLQNILQGRKNKAAELKRRTSENNKHSHPYIKHGFMMCSAVLLALGLAYFSLSYLQTKTPDSFNDRASTLYEHGKYDEAMNLYQEAYNRYPNVLTFLTGIARSAEKAGRTQTANIAWNEYRSLLPKDESEDAASENQPEILNVNVRTEGDTADGKKKTERLTFSEYLNEGNREYNKRMYNAALINFFHALEQRNDDVRPYIGIAESYRAKGMYFDADRILSEAGRIFRRDPTIETLRRVIDEER